MKRLLKPSAHSEFPHSRCRRLVSNVRLLGGTDDAFRATSNYITWRSKMGETQCYFGHHLYELRKDAGALRIVCKTSFLDADDLREQNKVSIIL